MDIDINDLIKEDSGKDRASALTDDRRSTLVEMGRAGIFFGRKKSKTHPKMRDFIHVQRNGIEIIDGDQSLSLLDKASDFLTEILGKKNSQIIVVGTHPAAKFAVEEFCKRHNFSYVTGRWVGGTLTNFKVIKGRVDYFKKQKSDRDTGRLEKYTKKEKLEIEKEIERMDNMFGGIQNLESLPKALIVIDPVMHEIAVREADRSKVPVVALLNTDADIQQIAYPIPVNTSAVSSIEWVLNYISRKLTESVSKNSA